MNVKNLKISDYTYDLPEDKIAFFPLAQRDASRLLIYEDEVITEDKFSNIISRLPANGLLVFNDSKVINARLQFIKATGGIIEIFLLEPIAKDEKYSESFRVQNSVSWNCFVGGASKWKEAKLELKIVIGDSNVTLFAERISQGEDDYQIKFSWDPSHFSFAEIIEKAGAVPLPPYIKRAAVIEDDKRYQTVYAASPGSVAAPTAGLHFTHIILAEAKEKNIAACYITLHVGAGTFKPVKAETMEGHHMHAEMLEINLAQVLQLKQAKEIIAVGTTSLRTLESIFHIGARLIKGESDLEIKQWDVYKEEPSIQNCSRQQALMALKDFLEATTEKKLFIKTQILIAPGYKFQMADYLITNFHQPQSTLLLLVAAAVGDKWKNIYEYALKNEFRFLSYGDTSLIKIK